MATDRPRKSSPLGTCGVTRLPSTCVAAQRQRHPKSPTSGQQHVADAQEGDTRLRLGLSKTLENVRDDVVFRPLLASFYHTAPRIRKIVGNNRTRLGTNTA